MATMSPVPSSNMIENACNKIIINELQFSENLIKHYGRLEEINCGDFKSHSSH